MDKENIRKEFFKLKIKGFSYSQCKKILTGRFSYFVSKRLDNNKWNLRDMSRKPHNIHKKITEEIEQQVISLRNKTGWGL